MPRPASTQVREHLQAYLLGSESLPEFHAWFVEWRRTNPDSGDGLTHDIDLRLAEYNRGHWSESQLRGLLLSLLEGPTLTPSKIDKPDLFQPYGRYEVRAEGISTS
jgi:hypothetical protein